MRIIAGTYRGRRLKGPRGLELRPTSDRLRETLFDILGPGISGSFFLDVFAGTGAVGLEACSRGAREVVFVDSGRESCDLIRHNLGLCGISSGYRLVQRDAFTALRQLAQEKIKVDIAFLDPPYRWQPCIDLIDAIFDSALAHADTQVIFEHHLKTILPDDGRECRRHRVVRQGDHCLSFYLKNAVSACST